MKVILHDEIDRIVIHMDRAAASLICNLIYAARPRGYSSKVVDGVSVEVHVYEEVEAAGERHEPIHGGWNDPR